MCMQEAAKNPDYTLTLERVKKWEADHGPIPAGAFVAMRTDWSKRWPDAATMENKDKQGVSHYPGWSKEALKYLYEERKITASGHETTDTDPGVATSKEDYSLEMLHPEHQPLSDRAPHESRPGAGVRRDRDRQLPEAERRLRISRAGVRDCAELTRRLLHRQTAKGVEDANQRCLAHQTSL